jgi:putative component of membrane protein insertase Oxa1/YidC/SpoIIIJ protein YidD
MVEALRKRGLVVGLLMGIWRLMRCNPFCEAGYDPVDKTAEQEAGKGGISREEGARTGD